MKYLVLLISLHIFILSNNILHAQNPEWIVYDTSNSQIKSNYIYGIAVDINNRKWILNDSGLVMIDGDKWSYFKTTPQNYDLLLARVIKTDNNGNVWLGGWIGNNFGVLKYDGTTWISYNSSNSPLPDNIIRSIEFDSENNMWILCGEPDSNYPRYLVKLKKETEWTIFNGNFCPYTHGELAAINDKDTIWSADELHIYKFKDGAYTTIPFIGLGQYVTDIKIDNSKNIWIAGGSDGYGSLTKYDGNNI